MDNKVHFISGLPRSGSTLLAAILRQNPRFSAGMTTPVASHFVALQSASSGRHERGILDEAQKMAMLAGVFAGYYQTLSGKVIFDTNRIWCAKLSALTRLFPDCKVICCVRDISWIMDSVERLIQKNPFDLSSIFGFDPGTNVHTRVARMADHGGLVGNAVENLQEAFFGQHAERLILVDYEALARAPLETMRHVYDFLGEPWFNHDFDNVAYEADKFDLASGTPGLHTVRPKIEWVERKTVLPPALFKNFSEAAFWMNPALNPNDVKIILPGRA